MSPRLSIADRAVALLVFGRRGYGLAARNLVASLRHYGYEGRIIAFCTEPLRKYIPEGVETRPIEADDAGLAKLSITEHIDCDTLLIDVDTVALKDITPLFDALQEDGRDFITCSPGKGKAGDKIDYFQWAKPETILEREGFDEGTTLYAIQSSWMFMRPSQTLYSIGAQARASFIHWDAKDLKHKWGGGKPDELFWGIACSHLGYDPGWDGDVMFYASGGDRLPAIVEKYYLFTLPGQKQGIGKRFIDMYDGVMRSVAGNERAKSGDILGHKYANFKNHERHGLRIMQQEAEVGI